MLRSLFIGLKNGTHYNSSVVSLIFSCCFLMGNTFSLDRFHAWFLERKNCLFLLYHNAGKISWRWGITMIFSNISDWVIDLEETLCEILHNTFLAFFYSSSVEQKTAFKMTTKVNFATMQTLTHISYGFSFIRFYFLNI